MKLATFAQKYGLRLSKDEVGEPIIKGIYGDISECDDRLLTACFWGPRPSKARVIRIKESVLRSMGKAVAYTTGSEECVFWFDPASQRTAKWFISKLQCAKVKKLSDEQREALAKRLQKAREAKVTESTRKTKSPRQPKLF